MKAVPDTALLVACLTIALVLRLAILLHESGELSVDRDAYLGIAKSVVEGRGYSSPDSTNPTAFRPPLYPLVLALGFTLFPQLPVVAEINLLTGLLTVCLTLSLGQRLQLGRWRFLAALLVSVDPLLVQYTARPMTESLCTCLTAFLLWLVVRPHQSADGKQSPHPLRYGLGAGLGFGLLVLCRPTFWPLAGLFVLWWLSDRSRSGRNSANFNRLNWLQTGVGSAIGVSVMTFPWLVRNWLVFGVPILTTTHGGYTLLLGNNSAFYEVVISKPWGTVWSDENQRKWESERMAQMVRDLGPNYTEVDQDRWNSIQAWEYIGNHPGPTAEAVIHRIRSLWNTSPQGEAASGANSLVLILVSSYYKLVLFMGLVGLFLALRGNDRKRWLPLFLLIISVQAVHLMYWTNTRMRAPLTPAIALFAAAAASHVGKKRLESSQVSTGSRF